MKLLSLICVVIGVFTSMPTYAKTYRVWNHSNEKQYIAVQRTEEACVSEVAGIGGNGGCRQWGNQVHANGWYGIEPGQSVGLTMSGPGICIHMKDLNILNGGQHTRGSIVGHPERGFKIITKQDPQTGYYTIFAEVNQGGSLVRRLFNGKDQKEVGRKAGEAFRSIFFFENLPAKCFTALDYAVIAGPQ